MKFFRPNKDIRKQRRLLAKELKFPYVMKATNTRVYLDSELGSYMTDDDRIPTREIHFIDLVKKHVIKSKSYLDVPKVKNADKKIKYFRYSKELAQGKPVMDCMEVDLKSAYWETANRLGILDPNLYRKASEINPKTGEVFMSKPTRLAAIGSLARRQRIYRFDGKKEVMSRTRSRYTEHLWDAICLKVGEIMVEAQKAAGKDFVFFWVDACFVKSKAARDRVIKVYQKHKYGFTEIDIERIEVIGDKVHVTKRKKVVKKKLRKFPFAPHKQH